MQENMEMRQNIHLHPSKTYVNPTNSLLPIKEIQSISIK